MGGRRISYDVDLLRGGGWVLWRTSGPRERVVDEGRFRPVGWVVYRHRRLMRSRPPAPPPRLDLFGCDHDR